MANYQTSRPENLQRTLFWAKTAPLSLLLISSLVGLASCSPSSAPPKVGQSSSPQKPAIDGKEDMKSAQFQMKSAVDALAEVRESAVSITARLKGDAKIIFEESLATLDELAVGLLELSDDLEKLGADPDIRRREEQERIVALNQEIQDSIIDLDRLNGLETIAREANENIAADDIQTGMEEVTDAMQTASDLLTRNTVTPLPAR